MDSLVFDTVVGVVFVFTVFAFAVSGVVEGLARLLGLRAEFLLRGISSLLDSNTEFKKDWLKVLVDKAEKAEREQSEFDEAAVAPALKKLDEMMKAPPAHVASAYNDIQSALEKIGDALPLRTAVTAAQGKVDKAKMQSDVDQTQKDANVKAAENELATAEMELDLALTAAEEAVNAVQPLLDQAELDISAMPSNSDRDVAVQGLAAAHQIFLAGQRAFAAVRGRQVVTVASVISQPIVDLTAALKVVRTDLVSDKLKLQTKWQLPSYLSARTFSRALVQTLVPAPDGGTATFAQLRAAVGRVSDDGLRQVLVGYLDEAQGTVDKFREVVEKWYDDHMARVTGWYKRHTRWYTLAVAAVLAVAFNVNAVAMAQAFYSDQALRESVVTTAFSAADCKAADSKTTPAKCLQDVRAQIDDLRGAGLPIEWGVVPTCQSSSPACTFLDKHGLTSPAGNVSRDIGQVTLVLVGWVIIVLSALMGARFWFDALSKLGTLRSSGPKPATSA